MKRRSLLRVLTNSERSSFACQRLWWFGYHEGLTQQLTPAPLRHGSLIHNGIAAWARAACKLTVPEIEQAVIEPWIEKRRAWSEQQSSEAAEEAFREDLEFAELSRGILAGYLTEWAADAEEWEYVAVEAQVARWLEHPGTGGQIEDRPVIGGARRRRRWAYGGSVDRVGRRRSDGTWWLFETKTAKIASTGFDSYLRKLHFDPQIRGYGWALQQPIVSKVHPALAHPIQIEGVIYDVVRKSVPRKPDLLKSGKGVSRAACDTTRALYLSTLLEHGFNPDEYADQLEALEHARFFHRETYTFTEGDFIDFGRDAAHAALDVIRAEAATYHPRQVQVCRGGAGFGCPGGFESICLEDGPMARASYRVMTIRHPELTGDLAEPWMGPQRGQASTPVPVGRPDDTNPNEPDLFGPAEE